MKGCIPAEFADCAYRLIIQEVPELECCYSGQEAWQSAMKQKVRIKIRAIGEEGARDYYIFGKGCDLDGRFHCIACIFKEEGIECRLSAVDFEDLDNCLIYWKTYERKKRQTVQTVLHHLLKKNIKHGHKMIWSFSLNQYTETRY